MTTGIYMIKNNIDGKVYVGLSRSVEDRILNHKSSLKSDTCGKSINRHLYNAVKKYGFENFSFSVLEVLPDDCETCLLQDAEYKWMLHFKSLDREFGYNLRSDNSTDGHKASKETLEIMSIIFSGENNPNYGNKWTDEMKSRMSEIKKAQYASGVVKITDERKAAISKASTEMWKDEARKQAMAKKVSENRRQYDFIQMTLDGTVVNIFDSMNSVILMYPDFYPPAIYNVCNGYKKTYRGYKWVKQPKI